MFAEPDARAWPLAMGGRGVGPDFHSVGTYVFLCRAAFENEGVRFGRALRLRLG